METGDWIVESGEWRVESGEWILDTDISRFYQFLGFKIFYDWMVQKIVIARLTKEARPVSAKF